MLIFCLLSNFYIIFLRTRDSNYVSLSQQCLRKFDRVTEVFFITNNYNEAKCVHV